MKDKMKLYCAEVFYLFALTITAGTSTYIQTIGRKYLDDYSSIIFAGSSYQYNYLFYFLGMAIFIGFMIAAYKYFLKDRISNIYTFSTFQRIIYFIIAVVFALLILAMIVFCLFLRVGLTDIMNPIIFEYITTFGWPAFSLIIMIYAFIKAF